MFLAGYKNGGEVKDRMGEGEGELRRKKFRKSTIPRLGNFRTILLHCGQAGQTQLTEIKTFKFRSYFQRNICWLPWLATQRRSGTSRALIWYVTSLLKNIFSTLQHPIHHHRVRCDALHGGLINVHSFSSYEHSPFKTLEVRPYLTRYHPIIP